MVEPAGRAARDQLGQEVDLHHPRLRRGRDLALARQRAGEVDRARQAAGVAPRRREIEEADAAHRRVAGQHGEGKARLQRAARAGLQRQRPVALAGEPGPGDLEVRRRQHCRGERAGRSDPDERPVRVEVVDRQRVGRAGAGRRARRRVGRFRGDAVARQHAGVGRVRRIQEPLGWRGRPDHRRAGPERRHQRAGHGDGRKTHVRAPQQRPCPARDRRTPRRREDRTGHRRGEKPRGASSPGSSRGPERRRGSTPRAEP